MNSSESTVSCGSGAALVLRIALAVVLFPHGAQKLLGAFGGPGFHNMMNLFETGMHIPAVFAFLAIMIEFFCPILLLFGIFSRANAFLMGLEMLIAMFVGGHAHNGFFMNWYGQPGHPEGFEYHLLYLGIAIALVLLGGGRYSVDGAREATSAT